MTENQNVTLSLPRELLKRVKRVAADRDTSVSSLMAEALKRMTNEAGRHSAAHRRSLAALHSTGSLEARVDAARDRATSFMSAEAVEEFVDANVLVYAFDASARAKQRKAQKLLERLWEAGTGCLSVPVLQEFFVTTTRKVAQRLPVEEAAERIREFAAWKVFSPTVSDVLAAIILQNQARLNFWDALVVQAAAELECDVLWTEDMNDGQILRGVRIRNPFTAREPAR